MIYTHHYESPLGGITIAADGEGITGLAFDGQKFFSEDIPADVISFPTNPEASLDGPMPDQESAGRIREYFHQADAWLDTYFSGRDPGFTPPLHLKVTDFRKEVCDIMLTIPFGKTMTYGQIAGILAERRGLSKMSAQAVGGAVGHNPVSLMIPCHRVIGKDGSLTGYAGGLDTKFSLLTLEKSEALEGINSRLYHSEKCDKILWHVERSVFMREALKEAEKAFDEGEVPVGAVVVKDGNIIGRGHNMTEGKNDPTAHAEMLAIRQAADSLGGWRLSGCDLYVTVEPCTMCAGAIVWSRIRKVYIGTADPKAGACGSLYNVLQDSRLNHEAEIQTGLMREESSRLMKDFFRKLRRKKPGGTNL